MRHGSIIFAGPAAITVMIFYYFIPFLIVAGAPDSFAKLRPFVITASVLLIAFGLFQLWRAQRSQVRVSSLTLPVLWFSALAVFGLILFPQAIANFLASTLGGRRESSQRHHSRKRSGLSIPGLLLLLRRKHGTHGAATAGQSEQLQSCIAQGCVQRIGELGAIARPGVSHLSSLFAGGLCTRQITF